MAIIAQTVVIDYTNYLGVRSVRRIRPLRIVFENNTWHHKTQWLLEAVDQNKGVVKTFAMAQIHSWTILEEVQ